MASLFGKRKAAQSARKLSQTDQDNHSRSQPTTPTPHARPRSMLLPMLTQPPPAPALTPSASTGTFSHALKFLSRRRSLSARTPLEDSKEKPRPPISSAPQLELNFTDLIDGHPRDGQNKESPIEEEEDPEEKKAREERILETIWFREEEVRELFETVGYAMKEKGFATPGLFLPHRPSQSPSIQHALLIYFAQIHRPNLFSFKSSSLSLTQPSPQYLFLTELKYALNVHDLASVIRFSIRHLDSSKGMSRRALYDTFAVSEREAGYPSQSWSVFVPEGEDKQLIRSVLEVLMSAASVVDTSGVSIGKLSMILGFWVFRSRGWAVGEREERGVEELFKEWEFWGRRLEHLLLAYIRDQASRMQIQTRLLPLISSYPNNTRSGTGSSAPDMSLTSHRHKRVLHLQIRAAPSRTIPLSDKEVRASPIQLIDWALEARIDNSFWPGTKVNLERKEEEEAIGAWIDMRRQAREGKEMRLERVFAAETIRILGIPSDKAKTSEDDGEAPSIKETGQRPTKDERQELYRPFGASKSSFALQDDAKIHKKTVSPLATSNHLRPAPSMIRPEMKMEAWKDFSLAGFGDSPGVPLNRTMRQGSVQDFSSNIPWEATLGEDEDGSRRISARSLDMERIMKDESVEIAKKNLLKMDDEGWNGAMEVAGASIREMDEAFLEFSQDIQLDPGSVSQTTFPTFALYELKTSPSSPEWLMVSISSSLPQTGTRTPVRSDQMALTPVTPAVTSLVAPKSRRQTSFLESLTPNFFGHKIPPRSSIEEKASFLPVELPGRPSDVTSQEPSAAPVEIAPAHPSPFKVSRKSVSDDYIPADELADRRGPSQPSPSASPLLSKHQMPVKGHESVPVDQKVPSTGPLRRLRSFLGGKNVLNPIDDDDEGNATPTRTTFAAISSSVEPNSWMNDYQEGRIVDIGRMPSPCPMGPNSRASLVTLGAPLTAPSTDVQEGIEDESSVDIGNDSDLAVIAEILSLGKDEPKDAQESDQEKDEERSTPQESVLPLVEISPPSISSQLSLDGHEQEPVDEIEMIAPSFVSIITPAEDEDEEVAETKALSSEDSQESVHSSVSGQSTERSELGSVATTVESTAVKLTSETVHENNVKIEDLGREIVVDDTMMEVESTSEEVTPESEYKPALKQLTLLARPHSPPPPIPARSASRERPVRSVRLVAPEMVPLPSSP